MKRIAMVCVKEETGHLLASQLLGVLGESAQVTVVPTEHRPLPQDLPYDLVLLTSRALATEVNRRVAPGTPIISTNRTLWRQDWQTIMALPARTRVLMVHETLETAHHAISLLYELGVKHLELLPFAPGQELLNEVDLAVTCGHPHLVPRGVTRVNDIGPRPLDPSTILDVVSRLDLLTEETSLRLQGWMGKTMSRSHGLVATISWLGELKQQFETVLDFSGDAIVACDTGARVTVFNQRAEELFGCRPADVVGQSIGGALQALALDEVLHGRPPLPNQPLRIGGLELLVTYLPLRRQGRLVGAAAVCRPAAGNVQDAAPVLDVRAKGHSARYTFADFIGHSQALQEVLRLARQVTRSESTVLIGGETGTGKEMLAQAIHNASPRQRGPFVAVNCAALPETLLESELFGYEEGSFTGALRGGKRGLFEQANRGTIFLDEIGDISLPVQARLLRVLEERQVMRVGGNRVVPVDVRVIAATNQDLMKLVADGRFRADLYYRLNVLPLIMPPLRQRPDDIPLLTARFLESQGYRPPLTPEVMATLARYRWPGNLRELRNCAEYMATVAGGAEIDLHHLPATIRAALDDDPHSAPLPAGALTTEQENLQILSLLSRIAADGGRAGRGTLARLLRKAGLSLTEAEVRTRLAQLATAGLVLSGRGRQGTRLTQEGEALLQRSAH